MVSKIYTSYTNTERNEYKIQSCVQFLCQKLNLELNIKEITSYCNTILCLVYKTHGQKRSNMKNAIIIICIYKVIKESMHGHTALSLIDIAERADIDKKYIYKAEKILLELPKEYFRPIQIQTPVEYVQKIYNSLENVTVTHDVISETDSLVKLCEKSNILDRYYYTTIGVSCLYYILICHDYNVDIQVFSELYSVSSTSIKKANKDIHEFVENYFTQL